jgi:hypothetical protein
MTIRTSISKRDRKRTLTCGAVISQPRYVLNFNDPRTGKRRQLFFRSQREAIARRDSILAAIATNSYSESRSQMTVGGAVEHWLENRRTEVKASTWKTYPQIASAAWVGTNKFELMIEQWADGGAARFLHDALNHSFRRLEGRKKLVVDTNLVTPAAVRQIAHSRSALEKCIVEFLLKGDISGQRVDKWKLDERYEIESLRFQGEVCTWMEKNDRAAAKHETALHQIIETVRKFVGQTEVRRPKGAWDPETDTRPQLPTCHELPPREAAVEYAWRQRLLTEEEYAAAFPRGVAVEREISSAVFRRYTAGARRGIRRPDDGEIGYVKAGCRTLSHPKIKKLMRELCARPALNADQGARFILLAYRTP